MLAGKLRANIPAPTLVGKEGEQMYLSLTNVGMTMRPDLFDPHSVHYHGFPNATNVFDGVPESAVTINQGATYTYYYNLVEPGTYLYHCHVEATEHMQMGMLGQFYVLPRQNDLPTETFPNGFPHVQGNKYVYNDGDGSTFYDVEFPLQISGFDPAFHEADLIVQPLRLRQHEGRLPHDQRPRLPRHRRREPHPEPGWLRCPEAARQDRRSTRRPSRKSCSGSRASRRSSSRTIRVLGIPMRVVGHGAKVLQGTRRREPVQYDTSSVDPGRRRDRGRDPGHHQRARPGPTRCTPPTCNHLSNWRRGFRRHDDRNRRQLGGRHAPRLCAHAKPGQPSANGRPAMNSRTRQRRGSWWARWRCWPPPRPTPRSVESSDRPSAWRPGKGTVLTRRRQPLRLGVRRGRRSHAVPRADPDRQPGRRVTVTPDQHPAADLRQNVSIVFPGQVGVQATGGVPGTLTREVAPGGATGDLHLHRRRAGDLPLPQRHEPGAAVRDGSCRGAHRQAGGVRPRHQGDMESLQPPWHPPTTTSTSSSSARWTRSSISTSSSGR